MRLSLSVCAVLFIISIFTVTSKPVFTKLNGRSYPDYRQCNESWGNDIMINKTICDVGCLMSSTASGLAGYNIPINGKTADPHTLNAWLRDNGGYTQSNDFEEEVLSELDPSRISWDGAIVPQTLLAPEKVREFLDRGKIVIANVKKGRHFVLVTGYDDANDDHYWVMDPAGYNTTYSYSLDIVGWRLFTFK